jgi:purine-cytosine permease-like protein
MLALAGVIGSRHGASIVISLGQAFGRLGSYIPIFAILTTNFFIFDRIYVYEVLERYNEAPRVRFSSLISSIIGFIL